MTKEPIMIDDVDVSKCEYHRDTHKELLADGNIKIFANYCQINNDGCYAINCYYKQLKRKEKECDQLRGGQRDQNKVIKELKVELDKYKPIFDRLLKQFETYDKLKSLDVVTYTKQVFEQLDQLKEKNEILEKDKANLDAIKETLKVQFNQLKAENEILKETISEKEKWLSEIDIKNSEYWKEKYADLHIRYGNRIEELKQALSEIKEVIKQEGYINKKTQIFKGSVLYQAMEDLKLPDKKILKIIERVLDV